MASAAQMDNVLDRIAEHVTGHRTTIVFVNTRRLAERLAHELGERLGDDVVAAHHGSLSKDRRLRVETAAPRGGAEGVGRHRLARAGDRHRPGGAGVPDRLAPIDRDVPPARRSVQPHPHRHATRSALPAHPRRARRVHGAPGRRAGRAPRRRRAPGGPARHPRPADHRRDGRRGVEGRRPLRARHHRPPLPVAHPGGLRRGAGARQPGHRDGAGHPSRLRPPRPGQRRAARPQGRPARGPHQRWCHPRARRLPCRRRTRRDPDRQRERGLGHRVDGRRRVHPRHAPLADPAGHRRRGPSGRRRGQAPHDPVLARRGPGPHRGAERGGRQDPRRRRARAWSTTTWPDRSTRSSSWPASSATRPPPSSPTCRRPGPCSASCPPRTTSSSSGSSTSPAGCSWSIHSPYGGRLNRALGYALRKKFCAGFNFELQASANDDAVVISLGPHHSFPLADVPRFLSPGSIRATLQQAILDQPIFQSRWRWNLNRSLVVLRFRGGKKVPPPLQRMQSDDLLAAVFPGAAACQENVRGPIEIPDHPLPRQAVHDSLTEALDCDGLVELWRRVEEGEVRFHFVDSTEPSLLAHEILTAAPYAFLDDGEAIDRRTRAVPLRRGLPVAPRAARAGHPGGDRPGAGGDRAGPHHARRAPRPAEHPPAEPMPAGVGRAPRRPPAPRPGGGAHRRRRRRGGGTPSRRPPPSARWSRAWTSTAPPPEQAAAQVLRGHLEVASPLTHVTWSTSTGLPSGRVTIGLAALEAEGFAIQGRFSERAVDTARRPGFDRVVEPAPARPACTPTRAPSGAGASNPSPPSSSCASSCSGSTSRAPRSTAASTGWLG